MKTPTIQIKLTLIDWIIEIVTGVVFIAGLVYLFSKYFSLPEIIPIHFNFSGQPDGFGNKITLLILIFANVAIYTLLLLADKYPALINYPYEITPENEELHLKNVYLMLRILKLVIASLFSYIIYSTIQTATGLQNGLGPLFVPVTLVGIFVILGVFLFRGSRIKKQCE